MPYIHLIPPGCAVPAITYVYGRAGARTETRVSTASLEAGVEAARAPGETAQAMQGYNRGTGPESSLRPIDPLRLTGRSLDRNVRRESFLIDGTRHRNAWDPIGQASPGTEGQTRNKASNTPSPPTKKFPTKSSYLSFPTKGFPTLKGRLRLDNTASRSPRPRPRPMRQRTEP